MAAATGIAAASGGAFVRFENVGFNYGDGPMVLHDVAFDLEPGTFHFLTGPSGAGKTSLLRLMYLADRPTSGAIRLFGRDTVSLSRLEAPVVRRRIGVVFQDFRLLPHLSAFDNVALPLRVASVGEPEIRQHVGELLSWVGLADAMDARPKTLSGGEQQRLAIARAVVARPDLLVADEPTGNVDDHNAMRMMRLFQNAHHYGATVVVATHNAQLVQRYGYPQLHLQAGRLKVLPAGTAVPQG
ncbi:MAG: cell division ATP-binding protein FtsE [Rhodospirillales bacterium]|nr:cell division ATP-binding protein FtsE [Rhodospirillales bacterium]